jgi:tetratricopeptide (TPR) repeat protein
MRRIGIALLLLATAALAQGSAKEAYKKAKRMRGSRKTDFCAEQAALFAGTTSGKDLFYLARLWHFAGQWDKAVGAYDGYLREAGASGKNRETVLVYKADALLDARTWTAVAAAARDYLTSVPGGKYTGRMHFYIGRAQRMLGQMDEALASFRTGAQASHDICPYEIIDTLVQLGRYDEAKAAVAATGSTKPRYEVLRKALPNLGNPIVKNLKIDFWAGRSLALSELMERPTLYSFWSTKVAGARDRIHHATNALHARYRKEIHVLGAATYLKFDPINMRTKEDMSDEEEQDYVMGWKDQYELTYTLVLMGDDSLHLLCGQDPQYPALPCFALTDKLGRLRYVRVADGVWGNEAVEAMIQRVLKE